MKEEKGRSGRERRSDGGTDRRGRKKEERVGGRVGGRDEVMAGRKKEREERDERGERG